MLITNSSSTLPLSPLFEVHSIIYQSYFMNRGENIKLSLSKQHDIIFGLFLHCVVIRAILCWTVLLCVHYALCVLSCIRTLICAQVMSNEALLDESLIIRFSASHHFRFAQKTAQDFPNLYLLLKVKVVS